MRHGTTLELVTTPAVVETLTTDFPRPFTEMAAAASGEITAYVTDTPSFGVLLTGSAASPTVSIPVYDQQAVYGMIHPEIEVARTWAENYYERIRGTATEITADLQEDAAAAATAPVALAEVPDPARVEREAEGFVQLTPDYFAERMSAPPAAAWRAGPVREGMAGQPQETDPSRLLGRGVRRSAMVWPVTREGSRHTPQPTSIHEDD